MNDRKSSQTPAGQSLQAPDFRLITTFRLLSSLCAALILSQFFRSAIAVIAPELMRDAGLSAAELGVLSGAFFLAAGLMQLPVGILLDRYGPRRVVPLLMSLAIAGAVIFAFARSSFGLIAGQMLIGAGCAGIFMGGLVILGRWVPPDRFSTVSAIAVALSGAGFLLSGTPFALAVESTGWRGGYLVMAGITAALALMIFAIVRDAPPGHPASTRPREPFAETLRGLGRVFRHKEMLGLFAISLAAYGSVMSIRGLWAGPYLADIHRLEPVARGNVLVLMSVGVIVGVMVVGPLDRIFNTRKWVVLVGAALNAAVLAAAALIPHPSLPLITVLFCLSGLVGTYYVQVLAHGRAFFDEALAGRAMTALNFCTFVGVGLLQAATGAIVGWLTPEGGPAPEVAYRAAFGFLAVSLVLCALVYARSKDMPPR